jgi:transcriptional regulator with XRE-family HTH domain
MPRVTKIKRTRERHFIKEWRIFRGLTQEQMASRVQLSRENYGRIEGGKVPYNQDFLELAAYALRCDPADLIMRNPTDPSSSWSIMDNLKKADASTRERIAAVVEALLKTGS